MATTVTDLPAYGGVVPNKDTQTQPVFDAAADTWIVYEYGQLIPAINGTFVSQINTLANELETARDTAITNAGLSLTYSQNSQLSAVDSENSALSAQSSATSTGTALAAANAILGLDIGTSTVDSSGHLIMSYNSGVVTPSLDATGHFVLEY